MSTPKIVKDSADAPFVVQILLTLLFQIPLALYILLNTSVAWWMGLIYLPLLIFFMGPHLLMLHNVCHRNPWKKSVRPLMDGLLEVLGVFYGLPPRLYYFHHIKMHHKEGNGPQDLSSTMKYDRDSFLHWLVYFLRFSVLGIIELPLYFVKRSRTDYAIKALVGYLFFYGMIAYALSLNFTGAIIVFVLPTLICWFGMMSGNWVQHAFIDTSDSENSYKNSITVIGGLYNKRCFNDGYHIGHHLFPGMHWRQMPSHFEENKQSYIENEALVFRSLDYQAIWFFLMFKRYHALAKFYVLGAKSEEEVVLLIKRRLRRAQLS